MDVDQQRVNELVAHPSEGLNAEIKRWIDPSTAEAIAKIVKATHALRNRNGGFLIFGFDDKTLQPDVDHAPSNLRTTFHGDVIQETISKYASEQFEVKVVFGTRDAIEYPIVVVPEGVTAPVAIKRDLRDGDGTSLLKEGDVYFRTLGANGRPSTSKARPTDWREIVNICFENREADFGRFLRRHLGGPGIERLAAALGAERGSSVPPPTLRNRAEAVRREGERQFAVAIEARALSEEERQLLNGVVWQISLVLDPLHTAAVADREFLNRFMSANPQFTGWPVWLDSRAFTDQSSRPRVVAKAWQALIVSPRGWSPHLEFMKLDAKGEFYLWRALQDDLVPSRVKPKTVLDPILVLIRVAEAIAVGLSVARALDWNEDAHLGFAFKWTRLSGRTLDFWANPLVMILPGSVAHDDEVEAFVDVPAATPLSAIAPYVEEATKELFLSFDGHSIPSQAVEEWVRRLIERRLNS